MKKKKNLKLTLNKQKVSELNETVKNQIKGGGSNYGCGGGPTDLSDCCGGGGTNPSRFIYTCRMHMTCLGC